MIQDYGFRLYNPAIGKFLSVNPLAPDYPSWTPYAFAMNRVIDGVDLDGLEWKEIKRDLYNAAKKGIELVVNTVGGILYAVAHPIEAGKAIVHETKETVKDVGTVYGTGSKIFGNTLLGTDFEIDKKAFDKAAQNSGNRLVEGGASTIIFGGILSHSKNLGKANAGQLNSGFLPWQSPKLKDLLEKLPVGKTYEIAKWRLQSTIDRIKDLKKTIEKFKMQKNKRDDVIAEYEEKLEFNIFSEKLQRIDYNKIKKKENVELYRTLKKGTTDVNDNDL